MPFEGCTQQSVCTIHKKKGTKKDSFYQYILCYCSTNYDWLYEKNRLGYQYSAVVGMFMVDFTFRWIQNKKLNIHKLYIAQEDMLGKHGLYWTCMITARLYPNKLALCSVSGKFG